MKMIGFPSPFARAAQFGAAAAVLLALASCGPEPVAPPPSSEPPPEEAGFLQPPRILSAGRGSDGSVVLSGVARARSEVRLVSPGGGEITTQADDQGAWRMVAPPRAEAALFGLSTRSGGRSVQAEGYVAVLPAPGRPAALLRAGSGAAAFGPRDGRLSIQSVDIDAAGAAAVSGQSPGRIPLSAALDGAPAGQGAAADAGGYQLALSAALSPGMRRIAVRGGGQEATVDLAVGPPRAPDAGPWRAERLDRAWRIDWVTPGMGLQTSFILDEGAGR